MHVWVQLQSLTQGSPWETWAVVMLVILMKAQGQSLPRIGAELFLFYHSFVNALTSAEVTEQVPINTKLSLAGMFDLGLFWSGQNDVLPVHYLLWMGEVGIQCSAL